MSDMLITLREDDKAPKSCHEESKVVEIVRAGEALKCLL